MQRWQRGSTWGVWLEGSYRENHRLPPDASVGRLHQGAWQWPQHPSPGEVWKAFLAWCGSLTSDGQSPQALEGALVFSCPEG